MCDEGIELCREEDKKLKDLQEQATRQILEAAEVICATCITAADRRLNGLVFQQVLIDEAT